MRAPSWTPWIWTPWIVIALAACAGGTPDGLPPPFSPDAVVDKRVLTGPEGVRVQVAQTDDAALVVLERVRDELDGVVFLTELAGSTADRSYETELNGRTARLLGRKNRDWTLFIGGPIRLEIDEAATAELDPAKLVDLHVHQRAEGRLAALARFDRSGAQTAAEARLAEQMGRIEDECGFAPDTAIDWSGIEDAELMKYAVASWCDAPRGALERACEVPELKPFVTESVTRFECRFGDAPNLELADGTLTFTVHFGTSNQDAWAREAFDAFPIDGARTVRRARIEAKTTVCAAPEGEGVVVVGPSEDDATSGVAYGKGKVLYRQPERRFLPEGWFFEPRFPNPQHNESFRGYDLRVFSYIGLEDDSTCLLKCGTREIQLRPVAGQEKMAFLAEAEWRPLPDPREPHALARDKRGIYYYVDRGGTPETAKDFRLYLGRQGRLRRQKMRDIVADSEGEIFASRRGRLKLFLGKETAEWQTRRRIVPLVRVNVQENLPLIYNRLGVYVGKPLHNPCDDL